MEATNLGKGGERGPGNREDRGFRQLLEHLFNERRREAKAARVQGASVFRDPNEDGRIWVIFDWDEEGWRSFISDPEVPAIFQAAGMDGRPKAAEFVRQHDA